MVVTTGDASRAREYAMELTKSGGLYIDNQKLPLRRPRERETERDGRPTVCMEKALIKVPRLVWRASI